MHLYPHKMDNNLLSKALTSARHQNIEAAIFQLSFTNFEYKNLLLGIFYYLNGEYLRAVNFLSEYKTKTSLFYLALAHIKNKDYKLAVECLSIIFNSRTLPDHDTIYNAYRITDDEYILELHAECLTQINEREKALQKYAESAQTYPLPRSCKNLLIESRCVTFGNSFGPESRLFADLNAFKAAKNKDLLQKYADKTEYCLFFKSEAARLLFEDGNSHDALMIFNEIKKLDNLYLNNIDIYSTMLWYQKDDVNLGFLCRKLVDSIPRSSITWLVLGNYFSLKMDHVKSIQCLKRSVIIEANHYPLTLLGHEYIIKQDYTLAAKFFTQSLKKYKNNFNALFGLGVVYSTINKIENAEYYLKKATKINPVNLRLKFYVMQFYNKIKEYSKAIAIFCDVFSCSINTLDIAAVFADHNLDEDRESILLESIDFFMFNDMQATCNFILENVRYRGKAFYHKQKIVGCSK